MGELYTAANITPPWSVAETDYSKFGGQREWEVRDIGVACVRCQSQEQAELVCQCLSPASRTQRRG